MDRFLSTAVNNVDAKGRVSVPARFRSVLLSRGYQELYALRCLDIPALDVGGLDLLDRYEALLSADDPFQQSSDDLGFFLYGDGDFLKLDADGRIAVTDFIREQTGIMDKVVFVGRGRHFQMWEPQKFSAYSQEARARLLKLRRNEAPFGVTGAVHGEPE